MTFSVNDKVRDVISQKVGTVIKIDVFKIKQSAKVKFSEDDTRVYIGKTISQIVKV